MTTEVGYVMKENQRQPEVKLHQPQKRLGLLVSERRERAVLCACVGGAAVSEVVSTRITGLIMGQTALEHPFEKVL
ncbi:hypothetical protein O3P69_007928 [Scylla paramamosain]|uniref:Uncharacterized protein n=1 Tax=Scylla paramamosain TaxID=85552 RepID=A0AAW0SZ94_SCYPA